MQDSEIFIVGANGQLGLALRAKYPNAKWADKAELDITNKESVENFDWSGIKIILNAAAYTNVDGAESPEGRVAAWSVNADAVGNLVAAAAQHDAIIVHVSTDFVFDGSNNPHTEDEPFSPLSVYGASKAAGDLLVSLAPKFYIIRTSWVIGEGKNFVSIMLDLARKGINPAVINDHIGRPTFTNVLVSAIDHLLKINAPYGTYNVSNQGSSVSWADLTRNIFSIGGFDNTVTNTTNAEYYSGKPGSAPRPLQSTLDLTKIKATGFTPNDWPADLASYITASL